MALVLADALMAHKAQCELFPVGALEGMHIPYIYIYQYIHIYAHCTLFSLSISIECTFIRIYNKHITPQTVYIGFRLCAVLE
jgi:hypothetical protein